MSESLKGDLVAIVLGDNVGQAHEQVIPYGTDNVYVANDETLQNFRLESCTSMITQWAQTYELVTLA